LLAFSGSAAALQGPECLVAVNTLNAHPVLGTVSLLNSHRIVHPLRFGAPGELDHWSIADWCDQCHRKAGLVVWADTPRLGDEHPQGEALAALVLGKIDAFEVCYFADVEPDVLGDYYRLLDCGVRVPLAGGSGKRSNLVPLGAVRTYAHLGSGAPLTYAAWIEAVRAGRTFITNAPLLTLTVGEQGPGVVLPRSAGQTVRVRAEARSAVPFDQLELLVNGTVSAAKTASGNRLSAVVETDVPVIGSAWIAARCWSRERLADGQCVYAHTSPVYLHVEGAPLRPEADTLAPLLAVLGRTLAWVAGPARCENERQRQHLTEVLQAGQQALSRRGECP
jgi:hypothetical protein